MVKTFFNNKDLKIQLRSIKLVVAILLVVVLVALFNNQGETPGQQQAESAQNSDVQSNTNKNEVLTPVMNAVQAQPDEHPVDSFDQALALHKNALEGDAKSQYLLGNIILECYFFAENLQPLKDDIALLLQTLPEDNRIELQRLADQVNGCSEFHQDNLQLFLDENAQLPESGLNPPFLDVALSWYAKAALQGQIAAIGQLVNYRSNLIDYRAVEDILSEALVAHNPDAIFSLGLCLADQQDAKVRASGISLMQSVCGAGQQCHLQNKNPLRNVYLSACLAANSGPQNAAQKEQQLQCYQQLNLPKIIEQYHPQLPAQAKAPVESVKAGHIASRQAAQKLMQQCLEY